MSDAEKVWTWHTSLRVIAVFNILLWAFTSLSLERGHTVLSWQIALSGVYVGVCAFRSWLPRVDLERYCIVDSPLSSMFLGRSAATIAEVCFAAQVALCVHHVGEVSQVAWIVQASYWIVPPLALAQAFCWYSVLTLNHLGHAIEQTLWTLTMAAVGVCLVFAGGHVTGSMEVFVWAGAVLAFSFVLFMVLVDVPMYFRRWRQTRRAGTRYLSLAEGIHDSLYRRIATREWATWRPEVAWLTGYFSVAVWLSLALVHFSVP